MPEKHSKPVLKRKSDGVTYDRVLTTLITLFVGLAATFYSFDRGDNKAFQGRMTTLVTTLIRQQAATKVSVEGHSARIGELSTKQESLRVKIDMTHSTMRVYCEKSRPYWTEHSGDCK